MPANRLHLVRNLFLSAAILCSSGISARALSATRQAAVEKMCRAHRLDCNELRLAVESVTDSGKLPEKWITKKQAKKLGWSPGMKLGEIAPGKSIGGDRFGNLERRLPVEKGRVYYEADLNYRGGKRGANRMIYSSDRLIYVTVDHYKTFESIPQ